MPNRISNFTLNDASGKLCARAFVAENILIARALAVQSQPSDPTCSPLEQLLFFLV